LGSGFGEGPSGLGPGIGDGSFWFESGEGSLGSGPSLGAGSYRPGPGFGFRPVPGGGGGNGVAMVGTDGGPPPGSVIGTGISAPLLSVEVDVETLGGTEVSCEDEIDASLL
jgi:hypothetical protein